MSTNFINASNLRAPTTRDPLVDQQGIATKVFDDWLRGINKAVSDIQPLVITRFGARGNGLADDTAALTAAMAVLTRQGGGTLLIPQGQYNISSFQTPLGTIPITILGQGDSSLIYGKYSAPSGRGHIDVLGSHFRLDSLAIDGARNTPVGLFYNDAGPNGFMGTGGNDPMHPNLSADSSVRVHGGLSDFQCERVLFTHAAGYSALIDAGEPGGIDNVSFLSCRFENNRQSLFGIPGGEAKFGGWGGVLYINGDGRLSAPGRVLRGLRISGCRFVRNDGNCCWSHLYGLDELHSDFQITDSYFLDCGLDGVLVGGVTGGAVNGNVFRRIGYTVLGDNDRSVPRWLPNANAVAIDSSGLVKGVNYQGNSILSPNGSGLDLDGHSDSALTGNVVRVPYESEPEFQEDRIAISGIAENGSDSYGINLGNTSDTEFGGRDVNISANTLLNLKFGSIRLYSARDCLVQGNHIVSPDIPGAPPIAFGPITASPYRRSYGHVIKHNRCYYNAPSAAPFIFEDGTITPFDPGEKNYVFGNGPILPNSVATEFQKAPTSGSPVFLETTWFT